MAETQQRPGPSTRPAAPAGADRASPARGPTRPPVLPLLLTDAAFRAELEGLVWEARRAEAVFVRHDADVAGAWERLADRLDLVQRAYALWRARSRASEPLPGAGTPAGAGR
jgi:hypothetical protein